jgi:A/G-specific adenine glycosylase
MDFSHFQQVLLHWFAVNQRRLPWRLHYRPYEIWISEVMLQQTQVKTMLPYYFRWMERFPDIPTLAAASEEELLRSWEGLGYYARVRNIHRTAKILMEQFNGDLPQSYSAVSGLPGIGRYTAGALMSVAFNDDYPVVDGNIARILSRVFDIGTPLQESGVKSQLWDRAAQLLPSGHARDFNQGLMDLGATVCLPKKPHCTSCPVSADCLAWLTGGVHTRPVKSGRKPTIPIAVALGVMIEDGRVFIQKRPATGLMPHLWEFPGGKLEVGETPEAALVRELREELGVSVCGLEKLAMVRHNYTTFRVTLHAYSCRLERPDQNPRLRSAVDARWVTPVELNHYAFPAANRKLIRIIQSHPFSIVGKPC